MLAYCACAVGCVCVYLLAVFMLRQLKFWVPNTQSLTVIIWSDMAPKHVLRRNDKSLQRVMCDFFKFTSRVERLKMRRDAIDVQLAKISMAKAQTIERKRKLTLKLKAVNEATREVKRLKSIYRKNLTCSRTPNWHWSCIAKARQQTTVQQQQQQWIQSEHGPVETTRCSNMASRRNASVL